MKEVTEQQLCDQIRQIEIEEKHWLEELEMETIKQEIEGKSTKDTEMAPVVQIVTEEELNCLEHKAITKHLMEIGMRLDWKIQRRHQDTECRRRQYRGSTIGRGKRRRGI